jgi:hypothetical protein
MTKISRRDRAATVARSTLQLVVQHILATGAERITLHAAVASLLRDEFADIERKVFTEIRLPETDTEPSPLTSTPRKGGGHEHEDR